MRVHLVWPAGIADLAAPSGGNVYDRRVSAGLSSLGWDVREILAGGDWPRPDATARAELRTALDQLDSGELVLFDGLVACGIPEIVVPAARRLRVVVLVHLRLAAETGLAADIRDDLDRREREVLHAAHAVVATSPWAASELTSHHDLPVDRVHSADPGVDSSPLARGTDGASQLLCVASVTPRKGHDLLMVTRTRLGMPDGVRATFAGQVEDLGAVQLGWGGRPTVTYEIWLGRRYRGGLFVIDDQGPIRDNP